LLVLPRGRQSCRAAAHIIAENFLSAEEIIALARKIFRNWKIFRELG